MRSQASKPAPKKGALSKTSLKASSDIKQAPKKSGSPKKLVGKLKSHKKRNLKNDPPTAESNKDSGTDDKSEVSSDNAKAGPSKGAIGSESPSKKSKKELKEKQDVAKSSLDPVKKVVTKKATSDKPSKTLKSGGKKKAKDKGDAKYKINLDAVKKTTAKFSKAKTIIKKITGNQKKKGTIQGSSTKQDNNTEKLDFIKKEEDEKVLENRSENESFKDMSKLETKTENSENTNVCDSLPKNASNQPETPKGENERPPKFFTSIRSPRTVDIDVKCCKTSKGNLSVSERFLSMKCESKNDETNRDKCATANALVSQGPDIDVYTFTEKVDSPKSILSDFRNPINKNVGRVRPIARVKGTVIDKKTDSEKKKYSPHRPIEEVVKQLKANKRSEEINVNKNETVTTASSIESAVVTDVKVNDDNPKPIVSKSYKMVARKSSITGKPFSPIKFLDQELSPSECETSTKTVPSSTKKAPAKTKKQVKNNKSSEDEMETSKFSINTKSINYTSSEDSVNESTDDHDTKGSSESDIPKARKVKSKKYKRITDTLKKTSSKELKELSKDSLVDLKDEAMLVGGEKPSKRRLKLLSMWAGPKRHRMASLNAIAKVHCLYENESRTHMELGLMKTIDRQVLPSTSKASTSKKKEPKAKEVEKKESTSESEYEGKKEKKDESSDSSDDNPPQRSLRGVPGIRSAGKYWDPKSSTSSSEDSELETKKKTVTSEKKKVTPKSTTKNSDSDKPPAKIKKPSVVPVKKKRNRNEICMDLKDMVVQKRMASLNATAILAASYEKRSPKSNKDETTSDSGSDESFSQKPKNGASSGFKSELKIEDTKKESDDSGLSDRKQKVEVIVNQDTDVTITGVYSTHHHEGFCSVTGMQYRISSTSHTQTTATANCEKEACTREDGSRYTPLSALSSMQPPAEHTHPHAVADIGGLARRPGCSSAFSAPAQASHQDPGKPTSARSLCDLAALARMSPRGFYQPAGPLIKESGADAERALARYHPPPHYHAPHPPVLQQYGPPYYPDLCYGRYYRQPGPYHMPPPQPDAPMVGVGGEPYPPPYYGTPPCYNHSPPRIPYVEYRGCSCTLNPCPKNVHIGPATGKAPAGGGPDVPSGLAPPGGSFRPKVRASVLDAVADTHGSGKDPPLESEPPAAADAPHQMCPIPTIGGASPKRELYDVRDNHRRGSDLSESALPLGPPSPARGSAGVCAPQPPPVAPRRARLGKAMARRSLAGDDTGLLLSVPQPLLAHHSDADDDVMAISPPLSAPIDLSSSDERTTPLVDVKKENEGPTYASSRKPDAMALREHNSTTMSEAAIVPDTNKAVKRRYSRPKLEIDMNHTQLEDGCKTNGIGEHVKLQKRRKVSSDQIDIPRTETVTKESKRKQSQAKRTPKTPSTEKKSTKRKMENAVGGPQPKKLLIDAADDEDPRLKNVAALVEETLIPKQKTKSALLLDNLIRKNSIDRADSKGYSSEKELNPAELFLPPNENIAQNCVKKTLNINNNIVDGSGTTNSVRPNTIAAVSQLIGKKLAYKNACKVEKVDSKVTHNLKSVLKTGIKEERKAAKCDIRSDRRSVNSLLDKGISKSMEATKAKCDTVKDKNEIITEKYESPKDKCKDKVDYPKANEMPPKKKTRKPSKAKAETKQDGDVPRKESQESSGTTDIEVINLSNIPDDTNKIVKPAKRCKLTNAGTNGKSVEKVVKLLVSKRPAVKADESSLVVEEACGPAGCGQRVWSGAGMRGRRRAGRRRRTAPAAPPAPAPRWSNGWSWDGEHYIAKVYSNNDARMDRMVKCCSRMRHRGGDRVVRGDCVMLRPSQGRAQQSFVARVASLWENPDDGEMMFSLVWYYRPEHTERGREPADAPDEVFASRHREANSVACIEDKCYVLTFNEYCRYRKRLKASEEGIRVPPSIVPPMPATEVNAAFAPNDSKIPLSVSPELVLFCRKIYDFRSKKIHVPNK